MPKEKIVRLCTAISRVLRFYLQSKKPEIKKAPSFLKPGRSQSTKTLGMSVIIYLAAKTLFSTGAIFLTDHATTSASIKGRVIVYIDGFNLYYAIKKSGYRNLKWLDLVKMSRNLLRPDQELVQVKYFTTYIQGNESSPESNQSRNRQQAYISALRTLAPQLDIFLGKFKDDDEPCWNCNKPRGVPKEKMTDVKIALAMVLDAINDRYDTAILVSADSDQVPTIREVRHLNNNKYEVKVAFPPNMSPTNHRELVAAANHKCVISKSILEKSQFPDEIVRIGKSTLKRPDKWK